eukprot:8031-Eustigmatos_ZCMA.PRE.1
MSKGPTFAARKWLFRCRLSLSSDLKVHAGFISRLTSKIVDILGDDDGPDDDGDNHRVMAIVVVTGE